MVLRKSHIFLLVTLIAANLIFAQEASNSSTTESNSGTQQDPQTNSSDHDEGDSSSQNRFFFTRFIGCNYTAQAGRTCANCRQTLVCLQNNIGVLKTCHKFLPFCNNGYCSFIAGSACNGTSSG